MRTKTTKTSIILLLTIFLLVSLTGNYVFYNQKTATKTDSESISKELDSVLNTKLELANKLKSTSNELRKYKGISSKLDSLIEEGNEKIKIRENKLAKMSKETKYSKELITQLQQEITELTALKEDYLEEIDELLMSNNRLHSQNLALLKTNNNLNQKIVLGKELIADNINIKPIKKNLFGKYTQTAMAGKTKKIEICFDVLANKLAKAGQQKIFVRLMSPEGLTIFNEEAGSGQTNNPEYDVMMEYTLAENIEYKNEKYIDCVEWNSNSEYMEGLYVVDLYSENNKMGSTTFSLK
jgi:hypothetical protein